MKVWDTAIIEDESMTEVSCLLGEGTRDIVGGLLSLWGEKGYIKLTRTGKQFSCGRGFLSACSKAKSKLSGLTCEAQPSYAVEAILVYCRNSQYGQTASSR